MGMEEDSRVKRKASIPSEKGSSNQGSDSSYSNLYNELLQTSFRIMHRDWKHHKEILVGTKGRQEESSLG